MLRRSATQRPLPALRKCSLSTRVQKECSVCILGGGPVGLLLSSHLSCFGIDHCVIERRVVPTKHPQAHFMNARTMEILQAHFPDAFHSVLREMPSSKNWRDFVYCHSVVGRSFSRVDHFLETNQRFWGESSSNIVHLPQNKFESILRKGVFDNPSSRADLMFGYEAKDITYSSGGTNIVVKKSNKGNGRISGSDKDVSINCDYLVAADGANSLVRRSLDIPLKGEESMHTLMNIHFTCRGLSDMLAPRPAMLYFVFNESLVAVFVAHDPEKDEWVCQIPIFPPFRNPEDFDDAMVQRLLRKGLGFPPTSPATDIGKGEKKKDLEINVLSINSWTMHAQVAESFSNSHNNVFLAGDAAHRFPPAGGFGMNTGLQDAHNIAWKLAMVIKGKADKSLLKTYESERKPVAEANTALSMRNYEKSASVARLLGVDPALAKIAISTATASFSSYMPLSMRKIAINGILDLGLSTLALLAKPGYVLGDVRVKLVQRMVARKESLPLIFPKEDIDFDYCVGSASEQKEKTFTERVFSRSVDDEFNEPLLRVGGKAPHCWLFVSQPTPFLSSQISQSTSSNHSVASGCSTPSTSHHTVISTVSLCGLTHNNPPAASEATQDCGLTDDHLPKVILLVDESHYDIWSKEACSSIFKVVAMKKYAGTKCNEEMFTLKHNDVQKILQQPYYNITETANVDTDEKNESRLEAQNALIQTIVRSEEVKSNQKGGIITSHDITGRWSSICSTFLEGSTEGGKDSGLYCTVALRPDGHVAAIFHPDHCTPEHVMKNMATLKKALHIL